MGTRSSVALTGVAFALCLGFPNPAAAVILHAGGTTGSLGEMLPASTFGLPEDVLAGAYHGQDVVDIDYPRSMWPLTGFGDLPFGESIAIGASNVATAVLNTPGVTDIVGISQGAIAVQHAAEALNSDMDIPGETTFVLVANPNLGLFKSSHGAYLPVFEYVPRQLPETRFKVIVVVNEYDAWADPIARPWNLLTLANAVMAMVYVHPFAQGTDLSTVPPENVTTTVNSQGGSQTTYLVPTKQLPLTMPLRGIGLSAQIVDGLDEGLRPLIDAGYDRRQLQTAPIRKVVASDRGAFVADSDERESTRHAGRVRGTADANAPVQPRGSSSRPDATGTSGRR